MIDRYAFKRFTGLSILFAFATFLAHPLLGPYLERIGFDKWQISLMSAAFALGGVIMGPVAALLAQKIGRNRVMAIGFAAAALSVVFYIWHVNWLMIVGARFLDAVAGAFCAMLLLSKVEDSISENERGKKTGWLLSFIWLGNLLGPLVGTKFAEEFNIVTPFIISVLINLLLAFYVFTRRSQHAPVVPAFPDISLQSWAAELKKYWSVRQLRALGVLGVDAHATIVKLDLFVPLFVVDTLGLPVGYIGLAVFAFGLPHLLLPYFGGLADKYGRPLLSLTGLILAAIGIFLISKSPDFSYLLVALVVTGFGTAIWGVSAVSLMSEIGERENMETDVLTGYYSISKIGSLLSFIVSAVILKLWSLEVLFLFYSIILAASVLFAGRGLFKTKLFSKT